MSGLETVIGAASDALYTASNGLIGRSWTFDALLSLALDNPVVKAGPIAACAFYVWHRQGSPVHIARRRALIIVTLTSLLLVTPLSRTLSEQVVTPRPFMLSEQIYLVDGGELAPARRLAYSAPLTGEMAARHTAFSDGAIEPNDLHAFPSDHASLFIALSAGILIACLRAGLIAMGWTLIVTLGSRVAMGMHSPLDVVAGGLLGVAVLGLCCGAFALSRGYLVEPLVALSRRREALASAALLLVLAEVMNAMGTLKRFMELGQAAAAGMIG